MCSRVLLQGRLIYATTSGDINHHCQQLLVSGCSAVGLDTEWRVTYRANEAPRKTALLQVPFYLSELIIQKTLKNDDGHF